MCLLALVVSAAGTANRLTHLPVGNWEFLKITHGEASLQTDFACEVWWWLEPFSDPQAGILVGLLWLLWEAHGGVGTHIQRPAESSSSGTKVGPHMEKGSFLVPLLPLHSLCWEYFKHTAKNRQYNTRAPTTAVLSNFSEWLFNRAVSREMEMPVHRRLCLPFSKR